MTHLFVALLNKELRALVADGRLVVLLLLWCGLSAATSVVTSLQHDRMAAERAEVAALTRAQWDRQGDKHPHRGAHFGLYAVRDDSVLAAFDPGVGAAVGQALYLEPHRRNVPMFSGLADEPASARLVRLSPAFLVEVLLPLVVYVLAFAAVTGERDSGTLRMLHGVGLPRRAWLFAKVTAVTACVVLAALPSIAIPLLWSAGDVTPEIVVRMGLVAISVAFIAFLHAALAVSVSSGCRDGRVALLVVLAAWVSFALVLPRFATELAQKQVPTPDAAAFWADINREVKEGLPGEPSFAEQLKAFERETLRAHGVSRQEDLPVGFLALRRLFRDAHADRVHDRHFDRLWHTYRAQQRAVLIGSGGSPTLMWRAVSMALAGTDLAHEQRFQESAERYRRGVNLLIDRWDAMHTRGLVSYEDRYAGADLWESMPQFGHVPPGLGAALSQVRAEMLVLAAWGLLAVALLLGSARRIAP